MFIIIAVTGFVTDKRGRKQKEISAFIVERTDPGFKVGKPEDKMASAVLPPASSSWRTASSRRIVCWA